MKHLPVYHYEVELKLTNPNTKEERLVTSEQPAYNPIDAMTQAMLMADAGSCEIKLVHVRPSTAAIMASSSVLEAAIQQAMGRLAKVPEEEKP